MSESTLSVYGCALAAVSVRHRFDLVAGVAGRGWAERLVYRYADAVAEREDRKGVTLRGIHRAARAAAVRAVPFWLLPLAEILLRLLWAWLRKRWADRHPQPGRRA